MKLEKFLANISKSVEKYVKKHGEVPAHIVGVLSNGERMICEVEITLPDPAYKSFVANCLAQAVQSKGFIAYAFITECWRAPDDWRGLPSSCPDRTDVVSIIVADRTRTIGRNWDKIGRKLVPIANRPADRGLFDDLLNRPVPPEIAAQMVTVPMAA
jgi:hypothetical protein